MARLVGINIPDQKQVRVALTYIFGIGEPAAKKILASLKIDPTRKAKDLNAQELSALKEIIEKNYKIEGELRREILVNIKRLRDIGAWRGLRHQKRLPARGQRTRTNTRTVRGNVRKTVGSGRKPAASPT
jgi:small subunit ribosomal protein S13